MNNYIIDSSIYRIPDTKDSSLEKKYKIYCGFLKRIWELITNIGRHSQRKDLRVYFFKDDILSLKEDYGLFTKDKADEMIKIMSDEKYSNLKKYPINDILKVYTDMINDLIDMSNSHYKCQKYSIYAPIETHMDIKINDIAYNEKILLKPSIEKKITSTISTNIFMKKIIYLSFLNRFIFVDSKTSKFIVNPSILKNNLEVTANITRANHNFLVTKIPNTEFLIDRQVIEISAIKKLPERFQFDNIKQAYRIAKNNFSDTLIFSDNVEITLNEYVETIEKLKYNFRKHREEINNHLKECPYTVYDHLDTLSKIVNFYKIKGCINVDPVLEKFRYSEDNKENTCFKKDETVCKKCRAFLRLYRYDCSGEDWRSFEYQSFREDRTFDDEIYQFHLKPYSRKKEKILSDLSLRIYFRWDTDKIKIGHIGSHL